jgi:hypothetical protein
MKIILKSQNIREKKPESGTKTEPGTTTEKSLEQQGTASTFQNVHAYFPSFRC